MSDSLQPHESQHARPPCFPIYSTVSPSISHEVMGPDVHHKLPEFTQTQVQWVSDAIHDLKMSCSNDCKSNGVFAFSCLDNLLQTSWPSLDPRRPVWALIASIFLPFLRGMLAAYTCLVSSRPAEWGRLLQMLTRHLQSLTLAVPCNLGAVTGWGGVRVRHCVMAGTPGPLLMIGRQGIPSDWWAVLMEPVPWS